MFDGSVTINGEPPTRAGLWITARIGDAWESPSVTVVRLPGKPTDYVHLLVIPDPIVGLFGSQIEFWLNGEVPATTTSWYAVVDEISGEVCEDCFWWYPIVRRLDLDFPHLP